MSEPLFVQRWVGPDTAGKYFSEVRCICLDCQRLTSPIHVWKDGEEFDSEVTLAELGLSEYVKAYEEKEKK